MNNQLFEQAKNDDILSKELISFLLETMEYNRLSFINDAVEILKVLKIRIERGDKITDASFSSDLQPAGLQKLCPRAFFILHLQPGIYGLKGREKLFLLRAL